MSNTELTRLLAEEPEEVRQEVLRINTEARPIALQVALLVPLLAGLGGAQFATHGATARSAITGRSRCRPRMNPAVIAPGRLAGPPVTW
jgi:hypothetical protein